MPGPSPPFAEPGRRALLEQGGHTRPLPPRTSLSDGFRPRTGSSRLVRQRATDQEFHGEVRDRWGVARAVRCPRFDPPLRQYVRATARAKVEAIARVCAAGWGPTMVCRD